MTTFDDRERAYEAKFAHDEELRFQIESRRNHLVGVWAAEMLGKSGEAANDYIKEIVRTDLVETGRERVFTKLKADLGERIDEIALRSKLDDALSEAIAAFS